MESFDAEGEDKRGGQVLSTELHTKVVEAFEVFDHENNKTVDVREVVLYFTVLYSTVLYCTALYCTVQVGTIVRSLGHCPSESQLQEVIGEMEDPEQMGYIHLDRFLPVMSR